MTGSSIDADVVVVGAGLAGLACAGHLHRAGWRVLVLEAADVVGGRVRTDEVDGFRCERGFQVLNPAYPEVRRLLDLPALDLHPFPAGVTLADARGRREVLDPRRSGPAGALASLRAAAGLRLGRPGEVVALTRWLLDAGRRDGEELLSRPDEPWGEALTRRGVSGPLRDGVLVPFLAGVLGEDTGETSHRFVQLLVRSFLRGAPGLPADGMGAIPAQLAAALPEGTVRTGAAVEGLRRRADGWSLVADLPVRARAVVVATDPAAAARLAGTPDPGSRGLTTWWFAAFPDPARSAAVHVDALRRGPVVTSVEISASVPGAAPAGRALVAATVLGAGDDVDERDVRRHVGVIHGADTRGWDVVRRTPVPAALTRMLPPLSARRPVALGEGLFVCGDHRDTASIQGALVSGRRAAGAVHEHLGGAPQTSPGRRRRAA